MKVTFLHHSSFWIDTGSAYLLFDWYGVPGAEQVENLATRESDPIFIFCSHSHGDHYNPGLFELFEGRSVSYLMHEEVHPHVPGKYVERVKFMATGEHIMQPLDVKTYGSTDEGGSFLIKVPGRKAAEATIFFAGDLNYWHWNEEADEEYLEDATRKWRTELHRISEDGVTVDLLFFPTDLRLGRDYLLGLAEFLDHVPTKFVIPMHINGVITEKAPLRELCKRAGVELKMPEGPGDSLLF